MNNEQSQASACPNLQADTHPTQTRPGNPSAVAIDRAAQVSFSARLYDAVVAGDYPGVKSLVDQGLNLDRCHAQNDPPILAAMRCCHRDAGAMVQLLALHGACPTVVSQIDGACLLTLAIPLGDLGTVSHVLEHPGVQIHRPDSNGMTAYRLAEQCANSLTGAEIFEMIKRHDQLNKPAEASMTPSARLCRAVTMGDVESVNAYLDAGGDPDACDGLHDPPLLIAAQSKSQNAVAIAELLSKAGADPNVARRTSRTTPLIAAIQEKRVRMVAHLLSSSRIDIHRADKSGESAYQQANKGALGADGTAIFRMLDAHHQAHTHKKAGEWYRAAHAGELSVLKRLYSEHGPAIVDSVGRTAHTALWVAAPYQRLDVVRQLLEWGADPSFHNGDGVTPIVNALEYQAQEFAALLVANLADRLAKR